MLHPVSSQAPPANEQTPRLPRIQKRPGERKTPCASLGRTGRWRPLTRLLMRAINHARDQSEKSEKIQVLGQVVPERKNHQPQNKRQPKPKSDLLGPLSQRTTQYSFASIVQKMPPVEHRNRKKVYQADAYG